MNWFWNQKTENQSASDLTSSILYNEVTFYKQFIEDLLNAKEEVIIESPYITKKRLDMLKPSFERLMAKGVKIFIITRNPSEHDTIMAEQSELGIQYFEALGPQVLLIGGGHHRKLAMIDRKVLWEGSLNILSQTRSREIMRRIDSKDIACETFNFLNLASVIHF